MSSFSIRGTSTVVICVFEFSGSSRRRTPLDLR
jgi:hypothetical protein